MRYQRRTGERYSIWSGLTRSILRFAALIGLILPPVAMLSAADAGAGRLEHVGFMASGSSADTLRMIVDDTTNTGFALGSEADDNDTFLGTRVFVYDLTRLRILRRVNVPNTPDYFGLSSELATIDPARNKVYFTPGDRGMEAAGCAGGPLQSMGLAALDTNTFTWSKLLVPCSRGDQFKVQGFSLDRLSGKMYAVGTLQGEWAPKTQTPLIRTVDEFGQTLLLRQMSVSAASLTVDWEIDLRTAGCDRAVAGKFGAFVERAGNDVLAYCYGPRNSTDGSQGFALRIPLQNNQPATVEPVIASPTLPNDLFPLADPVSGRMLLLTTGSANGTAVWVWSPQRERFAGVIASGLSGNAGGTIYSGLNASTGRTYLLTSAGILVADTRTYPLPSGLGFPLLREIGNQGAGPYIAVAPKLSRLFVPVAGEGFAVLQDNVPSAPNDPPPDPDRGTADIPEVAGKTGSVFAGAAAGFGAHILSTGGITRGVNNIDPFCYTLLSQFVKDAQGRCLSDQFMTSGNRDLFLAASQVELGSQTGASAHAAGAAFARNDTATDADFKRLGYCEADLIREKSGLVPPKDYSTFCASSPLAPFVGGTAGQDNDGYPVPGSSCEEFGDTRSEDMQKPGERGPLSTAGSSNVRCDGGSRDTYSKATASGLALPDTSSPTLAIARTTSETTSKLTPVGIQTKVTAVAAGITFAGYSIGEITTEVTTVAHGQTGKNSKRLTRTISEVSGPGLKPCTVCDWKEVLSAMNRSLGQRIRVTQPPALEFASPKGYQALVLKDPELRDSDRTGNDDDTFAVSALQIVLFNDGREGRNRLVIQLAGVQAESRYGIFPLPEESASSDTDSSVDFSALDEIGTFGEISDPPSLMEKIGRTLGAVLTAPARLVRDAIELVVTNPKEFAALFSLWSLLASPAYLALRRASLGRLAG